MFEVICREIKIMLVDTWVFGDGLQPQSNAVDVWVDTAIYHSSFSQSRGLPF